MKPASLPCAIYTRKSSEEGLEQDFNSLDAQREACAAYILSQKALGWKPVPAVYDDGGFSGGNTERPALQRLLTDIALGKVKVVVVYKVDRLTRSLADFAKMVDLFDAHGVSFVSVTQQFNTTTSMGRLTLNVLLSFAQFEREVTGERIRDKIAASKQKGLWMGGIPPVGYRPEGRTLVPVPEQAQMIVAIFELYLQLGCVSKLKTELENRGWRTPIRESKRPGQSGNRPFSRGHLYRVLSNPIYIGRIPHKDTSYPGNHPAIVNQALWDQVQAQLQTNQQGQKTRTHAAEPSLLAGLVFDEQGNRLIASHAKKAGKRYRYYIRSADTPDGDKTGDKTNDVKEALRLPAPELEALVVTQLSQWLLDEERLLKAMFQADLPDARTIQNIFRQARLWAEQLQSNDAKQKLQILQALVQKVVIADAHVDLKIKADELLGMHEAEETSQSNTQLEEHLLTLSIPAQLKRCGMAMRLVLNDKGASANKVDPHLVGLLQRSNALAIELFSGKYASVAALAQAHGLTASYVIRVIYLAFLAPGIVQRIIVGTHPVGLDAKALLLKKDMPVDWDAQWDWMGMEQ